MRLTLGMVVNDEIVLSALNRSLLEITIVMKVELLDYEENSFRAPSVRGIGGRDSLRGQLEEKSLCNLGKVELLFGLRVISKQPSSASTRPPALPEPVPTSRGLSAF